MTGKPSRFCSPPSDDQIETATRTDLAHARHRDDLHELADCLPNLFWIGRPDGNCERFNRRWYVYTGATAEATTGSGWSSLIHPEEREAVLARWRESIQSGGDFHAECRLREASGEYRWHALRAAPRRDSAGRIAEWYCTATDIELLHAENIDVRNAAASDKQRLAEAGEQVAFRLARQLDFTQGLTDSLAVGIYSVDAEGRATFVNPAAEETLGWKADELIGREMHAVVHYQHSDHSTHPSEACPLLKVLRTGELVRVEDDVFTARNGRIIPVAYSSAPVRQGEKIIGAVVSFQDISERKRQEEALRESEHRLLLAKDDLEKRVQERTAELREMNARLEVSNRELQDFASVASHDLQEPLRKIQAFGDRLAMRAGDALGPESQDYLKRMKNAAGRMQSLISDLLSFSRITTKAQPFAPVDLRHIAEEVMMDLESAVEASGGRVELGELPTIDADALQMRQLLQNLIGNALKFRRPDVPPLIRVYARIQDATAGEQRCELYVEDNGIGFDEKYLDRIFNVFQRLHGRNAYEGTGIGLAVCRKIAERHGGAITARSVPGVGSTFVVSLPTRHAQDVENPLSLEESDAHD